MVVISCAAFNCRSRPLLISLPLCGCPCRLGSSHSTVSLVAVAIDDF